MGMSWEAYLAYGYKLSDEMNSKLQGEDVNCSYKYSWKENFELLREFENELEQFDCELIRYAFSAEPKYFISFIKYETYDDSKRIDISNLKGEEVSAPQLPKEFLEKYDLNDLGWYLLAAFEE